MHASLKLYATLRTLTQVEDPNDDLVDALKDSEENVAKGLINLLKHSQRKFWSFINLLIPANETKTFLTNFTNL